MKSSVRFPFSWPLLLAAVLFGSPAGSADSPAKPIRALLLTGGCCHDYDQQRLILSEGVGERVRVDWTIVQEGGTATKHEYEMLTKPGWSDPFDVVIYNLCFSDVENKDYVEAIAAVHKEGLPAVALHCTYHSHHWKVGTEAWEELLGVTSPRHGAHHPITVTPLAPEHPVMKGFPAEWITPQGELYHVEKTWPTATPLAKGTIDGGKTFHECVWVNAYGKARIFGTTLGHHNETMAQPVYLDLLARGLLWVTGHLREDGTAEEGFAAAAP